MHVVIVMQSPKFVCFVNCKLSTKGKEASREEGGFKHSEEVKFADHEGKSAHEGKSQNLQLALRRQDIGMVLIL